MLECLVLGDSIATGVGQARPECETVARVGITSGAYINDLFPLADHTAQTAVISLGVNDDASVDTLENLRRMRRSLRVASAIWLLPGLKENVRSAIRTVARENGDQLVDTRQQVGPDHLHPSRTGYHIIAEQTLRPGETQVAYDDSPRSLPEPSAPRYAPLTGNLARYRLHVVFRGKLQQMADLRLQLAHQQAGYTNWPPPRITYGALPPTNYAYGAFR